MVLEISLIVLVGLVAAWKYIRAFFIKTAIPWLRQRNEAVADVVGKIVFYIDTPISLTTVQLRKAWQTFVTRVLRVRRHVDLSNLSEPMVEVETGVLNADGTITIEKARHRYSFEELPPQARERALVNGQTSIVIDDLEDLRKVAVQTAQKQGVELTYSNG